MSATTQLAAESQNPLVPQLYDIVWSTVAFVVILLVFWKFVIPRYNKILDERTEKIEGGIERAEAVQAEAEETRAKYRAQLSEARTEAGQIREAARAQGQQIIRDMKSQAQEESDRIVSAGNSQLHAQRQQLVAELQGDVRRNSVVLAEKIVGRSLAGDVAKAGSIDQFLSELDGPVQSGK